MVDKEKLAGIVGNNISKQRKRRKRTQEALADMIGLNRTSIVNIENGRHLPSLLVLYNTANVLEVDICDLLPGSSEILSSDQVGDAIKNLKFLNQDQKNSLLDAVQNKK